MALKKHLGNLGSLMRKPTAHDVTFDPESDTPEANAVRGVTAFCESGAENSGEEVLHLPTIVEAAVASPTAATAAAQQIRRYLSKENYARPHVQYNAIMLIRILADNPGQSFTKNLDKNFADTAKQLLRNGQDPSVAQITRETLDALEREKAYDTNLNTVFAMWRKEKGLMANAAKQFSPRTLNAPGWNAQQQFGGGFSSGRGSSKGLPAPAELAGRIEEARTSAKLLLQLVQSTPANELLANDLVKEFSERCISAQRSIQGYINCDNPAPDDDTMLTLIETNEQLSLAASKHQRAVLQARRLMGHTPSPPISGPPSDIPVAAPPSLPPRLDAPILPYRDRENQSTEQPRTSERDDPLFPISLQAAPGQRKNPETESKPEPKPTDDNPFADHYTSSYMPPAGVSTENERNANGGGWRGPSDPYDPLPQPQVPQSTPSYLGRQESAANNVTMRGAQQPTEEEEYARDYPVSNTQQQQTTEHSGQHGRQHSDVSPIAERGQVTYRY